VLVYASIEEAARELDPATTLSIDLTPVPAHGKVNGELLAAGFHCLSEKPGAGSAAEWRDLVALARSRGRALVSAPQLHRGWSVTTARSILDEGGLGPPTAAHLDASKVGAAVDGELDPHRAWFYDRSVGAAMDLGLYPLATAIALLGRPASWSWQPMPAGAVRAELAAIRHGAAVIPAHALHETLVLTLAWAAGPVASVHVAFGRHRLGMPSCTVYCTRGRVELDLWAPDGPVRVVETPSYWEERSQELAPGGPRRNGYDLNLAFCLRCLHDPGLLPDHWEQVAAVLEVVDDRPGAAA
jgi:predicted dehydrogenase